MYLALATLAVVLASAGWLLWHLIVQNGRILLRVETLEAAHAKASEPDGQPKSLPVGAVLHDFELPLLTGDLMTFSQWQGQRFLLIFVDPGCVYCQSLASRLVATPAIPTLIVSMGDRERNRALFAAAHPVLLQEGTEVAELFQIVVTPSGYLVDELGSAASELLLGAEALLAVMKNGVPQNETSALKVTPSYAGTPPKHDGLKAGTLAPAFTLPQLNGEELSLSAFAGQNVLLVFWDPCCAPCVALAPKLEQIHRSSPNLRVLAISRGKVQDNCDIVAELELTFPMVLQRHWEISQSYGTLATPVGYLIGGDGRLGSDVSVGESGILGLVSKIEKEKSLEQAV